MTATPQNNYLKPQDLPEKLVYYYILSTYLLYALGLQYILAQMLATLLIAYLLVQIYQQSSDTPAEERIYISPAAWVWLLSGLVLMACTLVNHANFGLGLKRLIETLANWSRSWGLFALFPLAGSLSIRPQIVCRAVCILCMQSLIFILIGLAAGFANLTLAYSSPAGALPLNGGIPPYEVQLFQSFLNDRLSLFTPWAPALGVVGNIFFFIASQEPNRRLRWLSMATCIVMILGSVSRTGIICLPFVTVTTWILTNIGKPKMHFLAAGSSFLLGIIGPTVIDFLESTWDSIVKSRAASSRARGILERVAVYRWRTEAPIWGHGTSEKGPVFAGRMPIGTHHTWLGLLFTHGLVGFLAFSLALAWSFVELLVKSQNNTCAKVGLSVMLVLFVYSFSEHLDGSVYAWWPGLLMMGIAFKQRAEQPVRVLSTA